MRPLPRFSRPRSWILAAFLLVAALGVPAAGAAPPAAGPEPTEAGTPVLGGSRLQPAEIAAWYRSTAHTPRIDVSVDELVQLFVEEGARAGVRGDLAFAQSMLETAYLTFPDHGQVRPEDHNFAGIGAFDDGRRGQGYPDARTGVRAQMQLLLGYADTPPDEAVRLLAPPASRRGAAPTWEQMGGGNWATDPLYAGKVLRIYDEMLASAGRESDRPPPPVTAPAPQLAEPAPPPPPPPPPNEAPYGYWLADAAGQVHDRGIARFFGSAARRDLAAPLTAMAIHPDGEGYWLLTGDGAVHDFGSARFHGSLEGRVTTVPAIDLVGTADGDGYWIVTADGAVRDFGSAGAMGAAPVESAAVALSADPDGEGVWVLTQAGALVAHGGATDLSTPPLGAAAVDFAPSPTGRGGWLLDATGTVHPLGDAAALGHAAHPSPVVGIRATTSGAGYWVAHADGSVTSRGDAGPFSGPAPAAPVVAIAAAG